MINLEQLKDLTKFLEGLTELSLQTGVVIHPGRHDPPYISIGEEYLDLVFGTDEYGNVTYGLTRASDA